MEVKKETNLFSIQGVVSKTNLLMILKPKNSESFCHVLFGEKNEQTSFSRRIFDIFL